MSRLIATVTEGMPKNWHIRVHECNVHGGPKNTWTLRIHGGVIATGDDFGSGCIKHGSTDETVKNTVRVYVSAAEAAFTRDQAQEKEQRLAAVAEAEVAEQKRIYNAVMAHYKED